MVLDLLTDLYWMYYKWIASRFIAHAGRERERREKKEKEWGYCGGVNRFKFFSAHVGSLESISSS